MPNKRKTAEEKESSLIVSRVQREAQEARDAGKKIDTGSSIIRSRVIHGADAVVSDEPKPTRKKATAKRSGRTTTKKRTKGAASSDAADTTTL